MNINPIDNTPYFKGGKIALKAVKLKEQASKIQPAYAVANTKTHFIDVDKIIGVDGYEDKLKYIFTSDGDCYYLGTNSANGLMDKFTNAYKKLTQFPSKSNMLININPEQTGML